MQQLESCPDNPRILASLAPGASQLQIWDLQREAQIGSFTSDATCMVGKSCSTQPYICAMQDHVDNNTAPATGMINGRPSLVHSLLAASAPKPIQAGPELCSASCGMGSSSGPRSAALLPAFPQNPALQGHGSPHHTSVWQMASTACICSHTY